MSVIAELIDTLENKIEKLIIKISNLEDTNHNLRLELSDIAVIVKQQSEEINRLKQSNETLKIANSLLGSNENTKNTKLKINSLIREIDSCIVHLSD